MRGKGAAADSVGCLAAGVCLLCPLIGDLPSHTERGLERERGLGLDSSQGSIHLALHLIGRLQCSDNGPQSIQWSGASSKRDLINLLSDPLRTKFTLLNRWYALRHQLLEAEQKRHPHQDAKERPHPCGILVAKRHHSMEKPNRTREKRNPAVTLRSGQSMAKERRHVKAARRHEGIPSGGEKQKSNSRQTSRVGI